MVKYSIDGHHGQISENLAQMYRLLAVGIQCTLVLHSVLDSSPLLTVSSLTC